MTEQEEQTGGRMKQAMITLPILAVEPDLFRHKATNGALRVQLDNPYEQFTIRKLRRFTDQAVQSVRRAVDVFEANELVVTETPVNRRLVSINRSRMTKPDDSTLQFPQSDFYHTVREAGDRPKRTGQRIRGTRIREHSPRTSRQTERHRPLGTGRRERWSATSSKRDLKATWTGRVRRRTA